MRVVHLYADYVLLIVFALCRYQCRKL